MRHINTVPNPLAKPKFIVILAVILCCSSSNQLAIGADDMQMRAFGFIKAKNFAKALESFKVALKEKPKNWQILQNIGNCHMKMGQYEEAVSNVQKSIELGGLHPTQCTIMAASLEGLGQPKQALNWLKLACSVDPTQASNPDMQAAIRRLHDPGINPIGSPNAPDYLSGLLSVSKWRKKDLPIKVYVRSNYQISSFFPEFVPIVRDALEQWCNASEGAVTYKFVDDRRDANLIFDYTDNPELCASKHEIGLEGATEMMIRADDNTAAKGNVVILVKNHPLSKSFRDKILIKKTCLHEVGHALGMHGHSPNRNDIMFLASTPEPKVTLSKRDKNTIRRMYNKQSIKH